MGRFHRRRLEGPTDAPAVFHELPPGLGIESLDLGIKNREERIRATRTRWPRSIRWRRRWGCGRNSGIAVVRMARGGQMRSPPWGAYRVVRGRGGYILQVVFFKLYSYMVGLSVHGRPVVGKPDHGKIDPGGGVGNRGERVLPLPLVFPSCHRVDANGALASAQITAPLQFARNAQPPLFAQPHFAAEDGDHDLKSGVLRG